MAIFKTRHWYAATLIGVASTCGATEAAAQCETDLREEITDTTLPGSGLFGGAIAVDGDRLVGGAIIANTFGQAPVFELDDTGVWQLEHILQPWDLQASAMFFGREVAIAGDHIAVAATDWELIAVPTGAVFTYRFDGTQWVPQDLLAPSLWPFDESSFGSAIALEGNRLIVGDPLYDSEGTNAGLVWVYEFDGSNWVETQTLSPTDSDRAGDLFGSCLALDGDQLFVGSTGDADPSGLGAGYLYRYIGGAWVEVTEIVPSELVYGFGGSAELDGDLLFARHTAAGTTNEYVVSVYERHGSTWSVSDTIIPPVLEANDLFGDTISSSGRFVAIGAPFYDVNGVEGAGAMFVYEMIGGEAFFLTQIEAEIASATDGFAESGAMVGNAIFVGIPNQEVSGVPNVGAVNLYEHHCGPTLLPDPPQLIGGTQVTFTMYNGNPRQYAWLLASVTGENFSYVPPLGLYVGLDQPQVLGRARTDANGEASWTRQVPNTTVAFDVWFQAVQHESITHVIELEVLP
ncbi:MAG: FG-GAP repeat protein [Phycisphaerales bacterium]